MNPGIFKAYDIRGVYGEELNEEDAWKIGSAVGRFLPASVRGFDRGQTNAQKICVGRDMRKHSASLAKALMDGIRSTGVGVIDIGMVDTPQVYFAINHLRTCGGVQVTASHNPARYNGFKISGQAAVPIGADTGLTDIKHLAMSLIHTIAKPTGPINTQDMTAEYKKHVLKFLTPNVRRLKVAIDASNGMAGKMVPLIFDQVPIDIIKLNFKHDGSFKHDPNPLIEANLAELKKAVLDKHCDLGICFDGDADRLMMVDEQGQTIPCDIITALMVPYFLAKRPGSAIVYDVRSSRVVPEEILKHGGIPRRERVGHAFMKKAMRDSHAIFGGELSGHFYYADNFNADSGLITLVHIINILSEAQVPASELVRPLRRYARSGEINFRVENKQAVMNELARRFADGQVDWLDGVTVSYKDWWFNCRASNTEPLLRLCVEAKTEDLLEQKLGLLKSYLGEPVSY
ncbi:MAG: phosphomannomutase/phosphoglucomutase [Sedimentisphaerales bacterium]|nr:phosphomannomutase/phosphoglucomutase [Sedimentisphaerales bacterium]